MDPTLNALLLPAIVLVSGLPVLAAAVLVGRGHLHLINGLDASRLRDPAASAARFARLLALTAIAIFASAPGFYWAHGDESRTLLVAADVKREDLWRTFLYVREVYRWKNEISKEVLGAPIYPRSDETPAEPAAELETEPTTGRPARRPPTPRRSSTS